MIERFGKIEVGDMTWEQVMFYDLVSTRGSCGGRTVRRERAAYPHPSCCLPPAPPCRSKTRWLRVAQSSGTPGATTGT